MLKKIAPVRFETISERENSLQGSTDCIISMRNPYADVRITDRITDFIIDALARRCLKKIIAVIP
jgi:hypothetical protein